MKLDVNWLYNLAFAVGAVAFALLIRWPFWDTLAASGPYVTLYPAVAIVAWKSGRLAGIFATTLAAIAAAWFFFEPRYSLLVEGSGDRISLAYFVAFGVGISWVVHQLNCAREDAEHHKRILYDTLRSVGDGVIATDKKGRVTLINPLAEQLTGWSAEQAAGRPVEEVFRIYGEDSGVELENPARRALREMTVAGFAQPTVLTSRNGKVRPVDDSSAPIRDDKGRILGAILVFRDISSRREVERRAQATEQRLSQLANSGVIGVMFGDIEGHVLEGNDELLRILDRPRQHIVSGRLNWMELTPPEYADVTTGALREAMQTGRCTPFEKEFLRPDGTRVPVLIGYVLLEPERERSVAFVADLTSQRRSENALRQLNEDLQHFTYGASHDLKEPLRMIGSYTQLLARRYRGQLDPAADEYIQFVLDGVDRMRSVVDALLDYSRASDLDRPQVSPVRPADSLRGSLASLQMAIDESGAVIEYGQMHDVLINATHLTQVFQNLVGNAIKYRGANPPHIHISCSRPGDTCQFAIQDNGLGIPPELQHKLFGVFQRLHGRGVSGTGLGLATTRRLVERYGGRCWAHSVGAGHGSTFFFTVPAVPNQTTSGAPNGVL